MTAAPRVAYLLFQSHRKGSYLHDGEISMQAGALRQQGIHVDVYDAVFDGDNAAENARVIALLADKLTAARYDLHVVTRLWDNAVAAQLNEALESRVAARAPLLLLPQNPWPADDIAPFDAIGPGSDAEIVRLLATGGADGARTVPGLIWRGDDGAVVRNPGGLDNDENAVERYRLRPDFRRIAVDPSIQTKSTHLVVYGNPGCPYRRSIREVEAWRGVELDPAATNTKGCSFCNINLSQDYKFVHGIAAHVVEQIQNILDDLPDAELIILLDQDPFPYLPEVFERCAAAGLRPFHLLIQARADLFLKRREKWELSLERARGAGHRCTPFLIGIENFHDPTLEFYNKGVTAQTNIDVLCYLRETAARYPDVIDTRHVSPGFIMWHPWVTFESLRTNVDAIERHGLSEFRSEVALSKIRLYPDIPFYWRAKSDGLFIDEYATVGLDSARRYGYSEEAPYRFAHAEAQVAYTLLSELCRQHEPIHELRLLALILDWIEQRPSELVELQEEALSAPAALVERFMEARAAGVMALRKENRRAGPVAQSVPSAAREVLRTLFGAAWEPRNGEPGAPFVIQRLHSDPARIEVTFGRPGGSPPVFRVTLSPRSGEPHFRHTASWNVAYRAHDSDDAVRRALGDVLSDLLPALETVEADAQRQSALRALLTPAASG